MCRKAKVLMGIAMAALLAARSAHATVIGNPLIARAAGSDGVTNVLEVYTASPVPADGVIDQALIYKQFNADRAFTVYVLRQTGNPNEYTVATSTAAITNYGAVNQVQSYATSMPVKAGDLFAHAGYGIPYDQPGTTSEPLCYPAGTPVTGSTITLGAGSYPIYTTRTYSLELNLVPGAMVLGNDLTARAAPSDGDTVTNVLELYTSSPVQTSGVLNEARIYKQKNSDLPFQVYVMRPTGVANQYAVAASSGLMTTTGSVGQVQTYAFPSGPLVVQPGDLFAHSGTGIPYTSAGTQPLYYPYTNPTAGSVVTFPAPFENRTYSLQVSETPEIILGNRLIPRGAASDGATGVFNVYSGSPMPGNGFITQAHIYHQSYGVIPNTGPYNFEVFVLHPTGAANQYLVTGRSGLIEPTSNPLGELTYELPNGWLAVQAGDLIAHYGRGIPYDAGIAGLTESIYYYSPAAPNVNGLITLPSSSFPFHSLRRYSLAVTYVPEPATLSLLGLGALVLLRRRRA